MGVVSPYLTGERCTHTPVGRNQMVDDKEKTRREIEVLKQDVVKDLEAFREEFQGMAESLAAAKEATQESNAKLGMYLYVRSSNPKCTLNAHESIRRMSLLKSFKSTLLFGGAWKTACHLKTDVQTMTRTQETTNSL